MSTSPFHGRHQNDVPPSGLISFFNTAFPPLTPWANPNAALGARLVRERADEDISASRRFGPGPLLLIFLSRKTQLGLRFGGR